MAIDIPHFDTNKTVIEKKVSYEKNKNNIEQQTKIVHNILWNKVLEEWKEQKYPKWIEVTFLEKNVFLVIDKNTQIPKIFTNSEWEVILSIIARHKQYLIQDNTKNWNPWRAMLKAWFIFWENLKIHKIVWYENWSLIINWKIDTHSKEYYHVWKKILFSLWELQIKNTLNSDSKIKFHHNPFDALLDTWAVTKEILEKINDKWILTPEDYQFWLDFFKKKEEQEKVRTHIDEAIDSINARLNWVMIEKNQTA